jgi:hypothetical protein
VDDCRKIHRKLELLVTSSVTRCVGKFPVDLRNCYCSNCSKSWLLYFPINLHCKSISGTFIKYLSMYPLEFLAFVNSSYRWLFIVSVLRNNVFSCLYTGPGCKLQACVGLYIALQNQYSLPSNCTPLYLRLPELKEKLRVCHVLCPFRMHCTSHQS